MLFAIVKKTYNVPEPEVGAVSPAVNKARIVKYIRLNPSPGPQQIPDWMAKTAIYKAACAEGSIVEVVMKAAPASKAKPKAPDADALGNHDGEGSWRW